MEDAGKSIILDVDGAMSYAMVFSCFEQSLYRFPTLADMEGSMPNSSIFPKLMVVGLLTINSAHCSAQQATDAKKPVVFTVRQDHQNMLQQLGITKLRPGRNGDENAPNAANYDEAKANPYPNLPDVMEMASGEEVTTPEQWWETRRPEIVELLEREVYGRIPAKVPHVQWEVRETREIEAGGKPAIQKQIVGVVDNSACPEINVNISMSLTLPKEAAGPVPVLMSFGWTPFEPSPFAFRGGGPSGPRPPSREDKFIAAGWGCAILNPTTVQDDAGGFQRNPFVRNSDGDTTPRGAGLTRGIIGLTNLGQPRKPDDWGALRAWGWGASRGLDYLETEPGVDAQRVGIAGVSRYGKAALVTMVFDQRFAMGLIAASGAGGTALYRRDFGESLENLAGSGAYHWMAGNYMKYSAEESSFGRRTADDLPVDSHMTLALCAPRLTFISHGIPERGDAHWLDHQGSFMAAIAAQPVFRLLGARDLGRSDDYRIEKMPAVNVDLLDGELDGVSPKVIVLQAGTNNLPWSGPADDSQVDDVVTGIGAIIAHLQQHVPDASIAQISHPNIVSVHEVGRDGDSLYIVSDFMEGASLSEWLGGAESDWPSIVTVPVRNR